MSGPTNTSIRAANIRELGKSLENVLCEHFRRPCRIERLGCRPFICSTSFAILDVDVMLDDGKQLSLLLKNLARQGLMESAREVKPDFIHNPLREIETYRCILSAQNLGTPVCYGAIVDRMADSYWLVLEKVSGRELFQVGEFEIWQRVAAWLACFHARLAREASEKARAAHLLLPDGDYYRLWPQRALAFAREGILGRAPEDRAFLEWLDDHYDPVIRRLLALPVTVIHGEFYPSNILVETREGSLRVCPVDWEMAAVGPGLLDLAALSAGNWTNEERKALAVAYRDGLTALEGGAPELEELLVALDYCHLHLNVQWLGWSPSWVPPPEHAQNWLKEAKQLVERIGL
jgi:hypothetical protein